MSVCLSIYLSYLSFCIYLWSICHYLSTYSYIIYLILNYLSIMYVLYIIYHYQLICTYLICLTNLSLSIYLLSIIIYLLSFFCPLPPSYLSAYHTLLHESKDPKSFTSNWTIKANLSFTHGEIKWKEFWFIKNPVPDLAISTDKQGWKMISTTFWPQNLS